MTPEEKKEYMKEWRKKNKEKLISYESKRKEKKSSYYKLNKEIILSKHKEYKQKNKLKIQVKNKEYQEKNKEQIKEKNVVRRKIYYDKNIEKIKQRYKDWVNNNPEKKLALNAKRVAAKLERTPSWLTDDQLHRIEWFYAEAKRLSEETGIKHHVDHVLPLRGKNVSGLHIPENLQILTARENLRKNNRYVGA